VLTRCTVARLNGLLANGVLRPTRRPESGKGPYDRQLFVMKVVNNLALGYGPILAAFERSFFPHLLSQDSR
jgi:hypothetical protein